MCDEIVEAIMSALAPALPDRVTAGWNQALGGLGTTTVRRMYAERLVGFTLGDDVEAEGAAPAPGLFGGEPAGLNELRIEDPDGRVRLRGSKEMIEDLPPGTRIVSVNGGGPATGTR